MEGAPRLPLKTPTASGGRLRELDALRGIAAFAVVLHHNLLTVKLPPILFALLLQSPLNIVATGRMAVMFFFVLSGFVLARSLQGKDGGMSWQLWLSWILQRSIRLILPTAGAVLLSSALYMLLYSGHWLGEPRYIEVSVWTERPTLREILDQSLLLRATFGLDNSLWSLVHEWRISFLLPIVAAVPFLRSNAAAVPILLVGLAAAGFGADSWGSDPDGLRVAFLGSPLLASLKLTIYFILPFAVGVALDRLRVDEFRAPRAWLVTGSIAAIGLARVCDDFAGYMLAAIVIWLALHPGRFGRVLRGPILQWLGRVSFSLYLTHEVLMGALQHALHTRFGPGAIAMTSVVTALPFAYLFYLAVERPAHRLARFTSRTLGRPRQVQIDMAPRSPAWGGADGA